MKTETKKIYGVVRSTDKGYWKIEAMKDDYLDEVGFYFVEEIIEVLGNIYDKKE